MKTRSEIIKAVVTILASLASITGCISMGDARYRYDQGWLPGDILQIGPATTDFPKTPVDCRRADQNAGGIGHDYAYVHLANTLEGGKYFNSNSKLRSVIVRIPPGTSFREGERVYVNIRDCTLLLARIE